MQPVVASTASTIATISAKSRNKGWVYRFCRDVRAIIGLVLVILIVAIGIFAPLLPVKDPTTLFPNGISADGGPLGPSAQFLLGTDQVGHDELSRMLWGGRSALLVSVVSSTIAALLGMVLGALAAFLESLVDTLISRLINILMSFPLTLFAVAMVMILKPSVPNLIVIMSVIYWTYTARLVRAEVLTLKEAEFISAARGLGARTSRIVFTHVFPNVMDTVIVRFTLSIAQTFLLEAGLSYLGAGVQPPTPDWGLMISQSQSFYQQDPALVVYPGLAIIFTVVGFNLLGEGLQRALGGRR